MRKSKNKEKHISTPKKLLILFAVILAIFAAINAVWYFGYKASYNEFASVMDIEEMAVADETSTSYYKTIEDKKCLLSMPRYLGTGGFLCVSRADGYVPEYDTDGNIIGDNGLYITLYIWPKFFGGYTLGLDFYSEYQEIYEQVYIDANFNLTERENLDTLFISEIEQLIDEYRSEIQALFDVAEDVWNMELQ